MITGAVPAPSLPSEVYWLSGTRRLATVSRELFQEAELVVRRAALLWFPAHQRGDQPRSRTSGELARLCAVLVEMHQYEVRGDLLHVMSSQLVGGTGERS